MNAKVPLRTLSRRDINRLADAGLPCPSLDRDLASEVATRMVRWRIKKQLTGARIRLTSGAFEDIAACNARQLAAAMINDDVFVGLRIPEAMVVFLLQLSLDAFKAVGSDKDASNVIGTMEEALSATDKRNGSAITVHFDVSWSKVPGYNFTYREAYDMRSHFVFTSLDYFLAADGYQVGVMDSYEGDGVPNVIRQAREEVAARYRCPVLAPREWTHLYNFLHGTRETSGCVYTARLIFDRELLYAHNITMEYLAEVIAAEFKDKPPAIIFSPFSDATIDIYPIGCVAAPNAFILNDEGYLAIEEEVVLLYSSMKTNLDNIRVSGVPLSLNSKCPKVIGMGIRTTDYAKLCTIKKVLPPEEARLDPKASLSSYYIEEEGRELWAAEQGVGGLGWFEIENNSYVDEDGVIYYTRDETDDLLATEEELTALYLKTFLGNNSIDNLWVLELNLNSMQEAGVRHQELVNFLEYCNVPIFRSVLHPFLNRIGYIYVVSRESPAKIIDYHLTAENYTYADLFESSRFSSKAREYVKAVAGSDNPRVIANLLATPQALELERISTYTYVVLRTERKTMLGKSAKSTVNHYTNHAISEIVRFPWVDLSKTITNDWHTNVRVLGVDVAHNNFLVEPARDMAACGSSNDLRHLILLTALIFQRGYAIGIGFKGIVGQKAGFFTEVMTEKADTQIFDAYNRPPDKSTAIYFFTGGVASRNNLQLRQVEVAAKERQQATDQLRAMQRYGKPVRKTANHAVAAYTAAVRAKFVAGDPYSSVPTTIYRDTRALAGLVYPPDLPITEGSLSYNDNIIRSLEGNTAKILARLRNTKNYKQQTIVEVVVPPTIEVLCPDIEAIYAHLLTYNGVLF